MKKNSIRKALNVIPGEALMFRIIGTKQGLQDPDTTHKRFYTHFPTLPCALLIVKILNKL